LAVLPQPHTPFQSIEHLTKSLEKTIHPSEWIEKKINKKNPKNTSAAPTIKVFPSWVDDDN